jgi:hypothetical protein
LRAPEARGESQQFVTAIPDEGEGLHVVSGTLNVMIILMSHYQKVRLLSFLCKIIYKFWVAGCC